MAGGITKTSAKAINRSPLTARGIIALLLGYRADVSDERMMAERMGSLAGERRTADQVELIGAGHDLAADRSLQRLPVDPVLAERVNTFVVETDCPSERTPDALMIQRSPSRDSNPSAKPPRSSKTHIRNCFR